MFFLWPEYLWLMLALPLLPAAYVWLLRRRRKAAVRYSSAHARRKGVSSTFLADRAAHADIPVFVQRSAHFRPPADPATPMIMVGPGTGVAPFRAFMQRREAEGATGRNWLFFGQRNFRSDFLYQIEWLRYRKSGLLSRLDVAFSRDQRDKIYVQHRMREHAAGFRLVRVAPRSENRFRRLEEPVAELVPEEVVERAGTLVEAKLVDAARALDDGVRKPRENPAVREKLRLGRLTVERFTLDVAERKARGVVDLVAEFPIPVDACR